VATSVSEKTELAIPVKNIIGMLIAASLATGAYFQATERIGKMEHDMEMMRMSVTANSDFRVKWPRGELGSLPADARQDLLIENLTTQLGRLERSLDRVDDLQVRTKLIEQKLETPR
jgi:hypothetical protein